MKSLSKLSPADRRKRIALLISKPETRSAVPDKYLPPKMRAERQRIAYGRAPVTPGSSMTNSDLARSANSQVAVKYGDAERQAQQQIGRSEQAGRDQAGWYDGYLKELAQHQTNITDIGKNAVAGVQSLSNAQATTDTTGLSADNARDATSASSVRKGLLASFGAQLTAQGANANAYADTLAHVVAPGQKLSAQAQAQGTTRSAQDALSSLVKEKGAYKDQVISQGITDEQKTVLAQQALGLDVTKAATAATNSAGAGGTKYGYTPAEWTAMSAAERAQIVKDAKPKPKAPDRGKVNAYGYTDGQWRAMTVAQRQRVIADAKAPGGKPKSSYLPQASQNTFQNSFAAAKASVAEYKDEYSRPELAKLLLNGRAAQSVYTDGKGNTSWTPKAGYHKARVPAIPKVANAAALTAALDALYDGHLSPTTIKKLHAQGIKVNPLGVSTKRPPKTVATTTTGTANPVFIPGGVTPLGPVGVG